LHLDLSVIGVSAMLAQKVLVKEFMREPGNIRNIYAA